MSRFLPLLLLVPVGVTLPLGTALAFTEDLCFEGNPAFDNCYHVIDEDCPPGDESASSQAGGTGPSAAARAARPASQRGRAMGVLLASELWTAPCSHTPGCHLSSDV